MQAVFWAPDPHAGVIAAGFREAARGTRHPRCRDAIAHAHEQWWRSVQRSKHRTADGALAAALVAAADADVLSEVVSGLEETMGTDAVLGGIDTAIIGEVAANPTGQTLAQLDPYSRTAVILLQSSAVGTRQLLEEAGTGYVKINAQTAALLRDAGTGAAVSFNAQGERQVRMNQQIVDAVNRAVESAASVPKSIAHDITAIPGDIIPPIADAVKKVPESISDTTIAAIVVGGLVLFGIAYYAMTTGTSKVAIKSGERQFKSFTKSTASVGREFAKATPAITGAATKALMMA